MPNPKSIKALTFKRHGIPHFTEHPFPTSIGKNCLLVKVKSAALNPVDIKVAKFPLMGLLPFEKGIGKDFSGQIIQVGDDLHSKWKVDDKVCGMLFRAIGLGSISSHVVVDLGHDAVMKMPTGFTYEQAAAFPLTFGTAFQALSAVDSKLYTQNESSVLVLGGFTSVGSFAIQLAKQYFGASKIVATCSKSSEPTVKELGADIVIDYKNTANLPQDIVDVVNTELKGKKFIAVIDCVGGHDVVSRFNDILLHSSEGSAFVSTIGDTAPASEYTLTGPLTSFIYRLPFMATRLALGRLYGIRYSVGLVSTSGDWVTKATEIFEKYDIRVLIDSVYDWNNWEEGWKKLENQKSHGKIVLKIAQNE